MSYLKKQERTAIEAVDGWPRLHSEKRLWVAHPCGFCTSASSRCSCWMNG